MWVRTQRAVRGVRSFAALLHLTALLIHMPVVHAIRGNDSLHVAPAEAQDVVEGEHAHQQHADAPPAADGVVSILLMWKRVNVFVSECSRIQYLAQFLLLLTSSPQTPRPHTGTVNGMGVELLRNVVHYRSEKNAACTSPQVLTRIMHYGTHQHGRYAAHAVGVDVVEPPVLAQVLHLEREQQRHQVQQLVVEPACVG